MMTKRIIVAALLFVFLVACEKKPLSYQVAEMESAISCEIWEKADGKTVFTDLALTDSYVVLTEYADGKRLHIYRKDHPAEAFVCGMQEKEGKEFSFLEFVKSNSRYPAGGDDVWMVGDKRGLLQIRCGMDSLPVLQAYTLSGELARSHNYNIAKDELYGIAGTGNKNNAFYFFRPDSGYYWVAMYGAKNNKYKKNNYAYSANLIVNEKAKAIACAYRFFNKVQFFDLRGEINRDILYGKAPVAPADKEIRPSNFTENLKCFIDICASDHYVYCLYDGSYDYTQQSKILVFDWKGNHIKTLQTDRNIKKIAIDKKDSRIMAIAANEEGGRDIVSIKLSGF